MTPALGRSPRGPGNPAGREGLTSPTVPVTAPGRTPVNHSGNDRLNHAFCGRAARLGQGAEAATVVGLIRRFADLVRGCSLGAKPRCSAPITTLEGWIRDAKSSGVAVVVNRPFDRGRLSTPVLLPLSGSGSFPRSEPHDRVRGPLIAAACQHRCCCHCRAQGPFRGPSLMIVFGVGASTYGAKSGSLASAD
jgi:hypothetical protein